jgi:replication factor C subunit 1
VKEIQSHIRLRASGDRHEVRQSYIPSFFNMLVRRLEIEGKEIIPEVIKTMDYYFLTREDWDNIIELGVGPMGDDTVQIPTQTKSAFTRLYNQMAHPMPFMKASSVAGTKAAKKEVPDIEDAIVESEDEGPADVDKGEDEDADLSKDKYVKQPKKKAAPKAKAKGKHVENDDKETKTKAARGKAAAGKGASAKGGRGKK